MPQDAVLHEFRSLVLFALKRYPESAAAIHAVLAVGPGWDWKTLSSLYADVETYTSQLRALEAYRDANLRSAAAHFLAGYHYLTCGHTEKAVAQFRRASELQPKDSVAAALVQSLSPRDPDTVNTPAEGTAPRAVPVENLAGEWTTSGAGASKYGMSLDKDGHCPWSFQRGKRKQEAKGVFSVEGNVLAMEP